MNYFSLKYITEKNVQQFIDELKPKLEESGFGLLVDLNLAEKFKENLDIDFDDYRILGACNPKLSQEIITQEKSAGLFLPCKIVVYKDGNSTKIELQRPTFMSEFYYSKHIESVTDKVETILDEAIRSVV